MSSLHPCALRLAIPVLGLFLAIPLLTVDLSAALQNTGESKQDAPGKKAKQGAQEKSNKPDGKPDGKTEESVKPGINKRFLSKKLNVKKYTKTFETESREVFAHRHRIAKLIGIQPGMTVADIGAGTGLFLDLFSKAVGKDGLLFAVDIAPKFIEHLSRRSQAKRLTQVLPILCSGTSTCLPTASVDIAFTCDTYHHFEYPKSTLASLRAAIRPGGQLVIVDFERIPGVSRKFIMGHVRCGKQKVIDEITAAGFVLIDEVKVKGLKENYFIRFKRPGRKTRR